MAGMTPEGSQLDPRQNDAKMNEIDDFFTICDEGHDDFNGWNFKEELLRGIYAYGFGMPEALQQRGIVPFYKGLDGIQHAQSGTGKTATSSGILGKRQQAARELDQPIEKEKRARSRQ